MPEIAPGLTIGQVAERTGLSVHTLRFYEREGILAHPVRRDSAGRRVYHESDVDWLGICIRLRSSGMPVPEIRRYTELARQGPGNEKDRLRILRRHQERLTEQISALTECLDLISYKVDIYQQSLAAGTAGQLWTAPAEPDPA